MLPNNLKTRIFEGNRIAFEIGNGAIMVNATEMCKPFNKKASNFLRNQQTQDYINALCQVSNLRLENVVIEKHGGTSPGTWLHQKLALRLAQWLSPEFSLWVDSKIEELLTTGKTEIKKKSSGNPYKRKNEFRIRNEFIKTSGRDVNLFVR